MGVSYAESAGGYEDAVGDTASVDEKWGPSIGLFQIRSLRTPLIFSVSDRYRYSWGLLNRFFNAKAAFEISNGGTDWSKWTLFRNGEYEQYLGKDYVIKTGHTRAFMWNL